MFYSMQSQSPVGMLTLASTDSALVGLWLEGQKYWGMTPPERFTQCETHPVLRAAGQWLADYFAGKRPRVSDLPLAPLGGSFRQTVWGVLQEIPYGQVVTYGEVAAETARRLGKEHLSAQAAGGAVGHNPISIIIPCHRVVGANGSLTGYAGGIDKKIALLRHEGVDLSRLFDPAVKRSPSRAAVSRTPFPQA